jgi:hypothetical protein
MCVNVVEESCRKVVVLGPDFLAREPGRLTEPPQRWPSLDRSLDTDRSEVAWAWRLRPQVTLIVQDGMARILDGHRGTFYALDPIGTRMLFAALEAGTGAMVRRVALDYGVSEEQVGKDWTALVEVLHGAGLAEAVRLRRGPRQPPGALRTWMGLTLARLSFALLGWERTLVVWRRWSRPRDTWASEECQPIIAAVDQVVRRVAGRHPLNPQCKERALVSWSVLRRMGLPARLCMGVLLSPFTAHAWTECRGQVVGDDRDRCEQFVPVAIHD